MIARDDDLASVLARIGVLEQRNQALEQTVKDAQDHAETAEAAFNETDKQLVDCRKRLSDQKKMIQQLQQNNHEADEIIKFLERRHKQMEQRLLKENEELRQTNVELQRRADNLNERLDELRRQYVLSSLLEDEIGAAGPRGQEMLKPSMQF